MTKSITIDQLAGMIKREFDRVYVKIDKLDDKFGELDSKIDKLDGKIDALDRKNEQEHAKIIKLIKENSHDIHNLQRTSIQMVRRDEFVMIVSRLEKVEQKVGI